MGFHMELVHAMVHTHGWRLQIISFEGLPSGARTRHCCPHGRMMDLRRLSEIVVQSSLITARRKGCLAS